LNDAFSVLRGEYGHTTWLRDDDLIITDCQKEEWVIYTSSLEEKILSLNNEVQDSLCWTRNQLSGNFLVKQGYFSMEESYFLGL